jgi:hexosaminidase
MKIVLSLVFAALCFVSNAQPSVIPLPKLMETKQGQFVWDKGVKIHYNNSSIKQLAVFAQTMLGEASGYNFAAPVPVLKKEAKAVKLLLDPSVKTNSEGYVLEVTPGSVTVKANTENGLFYGLQTLVQLIPVNGNKITNAVFIEDEPRFKWRV